MRAIPGKLVPVLAAGAAVALPAVPGPAFGDDGRAACIGSGTEAAINAALKGTGARATLCPGAVFTLDNEVAFTAPNQVIETQGLPGDNSRATLRLNGANLGTAITGNGQAGAVIQNIQVDGRFPTLPRIGGGALIEMGNRGVNQTVRNVYAHHTRTWSILHFTEGAVSNNNPQCQGAKILNNTLGPGGLAQHNTWSDGISLACGKSQVEGNVITDATDGGIVIFGAPGSSVRNNRVIARSQALLGGINLVDYKPTNGNYNGTTVTGNTIDAQGSLVKVGIAMGPAVWTCSKDTVYGAKVTGNTLQGGHMGYGYAVNGVKDFTVTGNVDKSTHTGKPVGGCGGRPAAPKGFQVQAAAASTLQPEFVKETSLTYLLGITP